jgi:hypothetical protein
MGSRRRTTLVAVVALVIVSLAVVAPSAWGELRDTDRRMDPPTTFVARSRPPRASNVAATLPSCRTQPLRGVHDPSRLTVLGTCRWATGRVVALIHEPDGDWHVDIAVAPAFRSLENGRNRTGAAGALVTEIMPGQRFPIPSIGERISVMGTWVHDRIHGWREIHPIWTIRYSGRTVVSMPLPAAHAPCAFHALAAALIRLERGRDWTALRGQPLIGSEVR